MTLVAFLILLAIPLALLAKKNALTVLIASVFGLFLGMTPVGVQLARALNAIGSHVVHVL